MFIGEVTDSPLITRVRCVTAFIKTWSFTCDETLQNEFKKFHFVLASEEHTANNWAAVFIPELKTSSQASKLSIIVSSNLKLPENKWT